MSEVIRVAQVMGKMLGGGVEAVVLNYYKHIDRSKVQFDFLVDSDSTYVPKEEIEALGGKVIFIPPYQKINKYIYELKELFKKENYKIVHSHINTLSVFPLYAAKKVNVPIRIAHSHSTAGKGEYKKNIMKYSLRPFSKLMANKYFGCSEYAGRWLFGSDFFDKGNVEVIRNAVDLEKFLYDGKIRENKRKELNVNDKFVIGHVGRFVYQKNHNCLIDIFSEVYKKEKNAILVLVGMGELESEIKVKVDKLGLNGAVRFLGQRNDVNELMQAFDVFLLPSFYEGLPVVGVEAQAAGLPCLLSDAMTNETKVLDSSKFMPLNAGAEKWAYEVLKYKQFERKSVINDMIKSGFEINSASKRLEELYLQYYKNVERL